MPFDLTALADLTLTAALVVAVVTLWRENRRLLDIIVGYQQRAEAQREQMMNKLNVVGVQLGVPPTIPVSDLPHK